MLIDVVEDKQYLKDLVDFNNNKQDLFKDYMWDYYKPNEHEKFFVDYVERAKQKVDSLGLKTKEVRLALFYIEMFLMLSYDKKLFYYVLDMLNKKYN